MANPAKVLGRVKSVVPYGEGVYHVTLSVDKRYTRYLPGQFLHLALDPFDPTEGYWPESRVFSIASEPRQDEVSIVYSVKGAFTKRMESELVAGREIWLKLPYGSFIVDEELLNSGPVVLVAGGTGVSPYLPFLKKPRDSGQLVYLYYGIRKPSHLLFREVFEGLLPHPWFRLRLRIEEGGDQSLSFETGRLSIDDMVLTLEHPLRECNFFLSGPPAMIRGFRDELSRREVPSSQIHTDEWE
jgi:ferredoxin-NADP reductase